MSSMSCAIPPSAMSPGHASINASAGSSSSDSSTGTTSTITYPTTGTSTSAASSTTGSTAVTTTTTTPPATTSGTPTCTISISQPQNQSNSYYYVTASLTMTSSTPIEGVEFVLSDGSGYSQEVGYSSTAPYQVQYALTSNGVGVSTLSATIVTASGQTYASVCSSSYQINW